MKNFASRIKLIVLTACVIVASMSFAACSESNEVSDESIDASLIDSFLEELIDSWPYMFHYTVKLQFVEQSDRDTYKSKLDGLPIRYDGTDDKQSPALYKFSSQYSIKDEVFQLLAKSDTDCSIVFAHDTPLHRKGDSLFREGDIVDKKMDTDYELDVKVTKEAFNRIIGDTNSAIIVANDQEYSVRIVFDSEESTICLLDFDEDSRKTFSPVFYAYNSLFKQEYNAGIEVDSKMIYDSLESAQPANPQLKKELAQYSEMLQNGKVSELEMTIYYVSPPILTQYPWGVDNVKKSSHTRVVTVSGEKLREQIDLLKELSADNLRLTSSEYLDARFCCEFSNASGEVLLTLVSGGIGGDVYVNGIAVEENEIFYKLLIPHISEENIKQPMIDYLTELKG